MTVKLKNDEDFFWNYQAPLFCLGDNQKFAYLRMFLRIYSFE